MLGSELLQILQKSRCISVYNCFSCLFHASPVDIGAHCSHASSLFTDKSAFSARFVNSLDAFARNEGNVWQCDESALSLCTNCEGWKSGKISLLGPWLLHLMGQNCRDTVIHRMNLQRSKLAMCGKCPCQYRSSIAPEKCPCDRTSSKCHQFEGWKRDLKTCYGLVQTPLHEDFHLLFKITQWCLRHKSSASFGHERCFAAQPFCY